jgi:hypothetical protein
MAGFLSGTLNSTTSLDLAIARLPFACLRVNIRNDADPAAFPAFVRRVSLRVAAQPLRLETALGRPSLPANQPLVEVQVVTPPIMEFCRISDQTGQVF